MQERLQSVKQSSSVLGQSAALSYEADLLYRRGCEVGVGLGDPSQYLGKATNVQLRRGSGQSGNPCHACWTERLQMASVSGSSAGCG